MNVRGFALVIAVLLMISAGCGGTQSPSENGNPGNDDSKVQQNEDKAEEEASDTGQPKKQIIYGPADPKYQMDLNYNGENHTISGTMEVQFSNNLNKTLQHVYFNLWPNAERFKDGGITVENVKVNGEKATYQVDQTKLDLSGLSLAEGDSASVKMTFAVKIPKMEDRFGWYGTTVSLGNWFPILAVYDNEGWNLDPYFEHGESFYSLNADFDVTLTADSEEVIAATGQEAGKAEVKNGKATHHYKARNVRDFAMQMNSQYHVKTAHVNDVEIHLYYTDDQKKYASMLMTTGKESVRLFSEKIGAYPWKELDIAGMEADWFGGMEYPQMVMISLYEPFGREFMKLSTAHEIGHQWFYGAVGNNEYDATWLDESLTSYISSLYVGTLDRLEARIPKASYYHLSSPVSTFTKHADNGGIDAYNYMFYTYGPAVVNELRQLMGDKAFYTGLQQYYQDMKFKIATTADFVRIMEKASDKDLTDFFKKYRIYVNDPQQTNSKK
ncbi:MAG TPA: M1 family metallopeptidase [Bacillales bacterium]|nr:M1 family metallopeptidase [Bacillales bacterium]